MMYIKKIIKFVRRDILRNTFLLAIQRWYDDDGDNLLRYTYPLNADSIVWDLGGYLGDFSHRINMMYKSKVYLFEPMPKFYESCFQRFQTNPNVVCYPFGLSNYAGEMEMSDDNNKSSVKKLPMNKNNIVARFESITETFENLKVTQIDLLKINIEGGEFDVLEALLDSLYINQVRFLQVQFHNFIPESNFRRKIIRNRLSNTHYEMWNYPFVWESWELK